MIKELSTENAGFISPLIISDSIENECITMTVFIAENGGRKSLLLRCLTEAALGHTRIPSIRNGIKIAKHELPKRVIAISGTPLDRFPRAGTRDLRSRKRSSTYNSDQFIYLGQRAINGMSGVTQCERSLVGSLFSNRHVLKKREPQLRSIFNFIDLEPYIEVYLKPASLSERSTDLIGANLENLLKNSTDTELSSFGLERNTSTRIIKILAKDLLSQAFLINTGAPAFSITPERLRVRQKGNISSCELLLRLGAVEILKTRFRRLAGGVRDRLLGDQLSSGQWNWLSTFGGLVCEIQTGSLVLIDEPENSLHPNWQRDFMPTVYECVREFAGCQVVVATHSPLIASGVAPEWGQVRTLRRSPLTPECSESVAMENTYGWSATDVYDNTFGMVSTRAPGFVEIGQLALERLAQNSVTKLDADNWIPQLKKSMRSLPPLDPLRHVYNDILNALSSLASTKHDFL